MICHGCNQDRPVHHMRTVAFARLGVPPWEMGALCRECRQRLGAWAVAGRVFAMFLYLLLFAAVAASGYGVVRLVLWIVRRGSTS